MTSFELIGTMRDRLEDIRHWRGQLSDVMLTITCHAMDLTGIRGTTNRIPGGDALAMLGPWAPDADHGDDLPHPDQILREWMETITEQPSPSSWEECWRWHWDSTPRILESPWAEEWQQDLTALWWRLARLTGNEPKHEEDTMRGALDCINARDDLPPELRLTARDADRFWPGIAQRLKDDRHHGRPTPDRADDRTYIVADLREYWARRLASVA
ncbi:hypothetical protein [Brachybacterium sp. UMB0905]|uniref:hypothetical protein n=1 Tax=Brachybacterium sp. UMB0905 TaxID=2069310 RepID=UPI000C7FD19B|nr:hypothetical protein [Brachybacterium sp. UMB0905]PMC76391.1 hypothetical protein CJ197_04340 [Brachybacterium sp. UMB0905]